MSEQQIRSMIAMNIIDNCTLELDNKGQEKYSLDEQQFGKCINALVKNINVIQRCMGEAKQLKAFVDWWHGLSQEELVWYEGRYVEVFLSL